MRAFVVLLALAGTACSHLGRTTPPPTSRACNAAAAQGLIGRQAGPALAQEAQRLSHAGAVRFLRPGQMVTMEYRADRLNIRLDAREKVEGISCG